MPLAGLKRWLSGRGDDAPMVELAAERPGSGGRDQAIPKQCFQTWEDRRFGPEHAAGLEAFREANRDITFHLWDRAARDAYMAEAWGKHPIAALYQDALFGPMKADLFRYAVLFERGGYYFDIKSACTRSLTTLHPSEATAMVSFEGNCCVIRPPEPVAAQLQHPDHFALQWALAAAPGHPLFAKVIENILAAAPAYRGRTFPVPKQAILTLSGPGMFTRTLWEHVDAVGTEGMAQCGVDLDGAGVFSLPGAAARFRTQPHYAQVRDAMILPPA